MIPTTNERNNKIVQPIRSVKWRGEKEPRPRAVGRTHDTNSLSTMTDSVADKLADWWTGGLTD